MPRPRALVMSLLIGSPWLPALGQSPAALVAAGDSLTRALRPDLALERYRDAVARDSAFYPALWKAGRAAVDVAKQIRNDDTLRARRDSLYQLGRAYAERAIRADSTGADGHFVLALALGRLARTRAGRQGVRFARIIYDEAARALALDPRHDGAHHILGAWHLEVKSLSGATRLFARTLLGGGFLGIASWDSATAHLQRAVDLNPNYIYHRLELAQVLIRLGRNVEARVQLRAIAGLPTNDVLDPRYRRRAAQLLEGMQARN